MLSFKAFFVITVGLFTLIGALRGWAKEIVATAGLILSLFALSQVGWLALNMLQLTSEANPLAETTAVFRRQFFLLNAIHLLIAFFSYQGPTLSIAAQSRLRARDTLQDKLLGAIVGALNGYLVVGSSLAFLEYRLTPSGFVRLAPGEGYPFDPSILSRAGDVFDQLLFTYLPPVVLADYLLYLMVIMFLFVIIVFL